MNIKADSLWITNPNTLNSFEQQVNTKEPKGRSYTIASEDSGFAKIGRLNKQVYANQTNDFMQNSGKYLFAKEFDLTSHYTKSSEQKTEVHSQETGKSSSILTRSFKQISSSIVETLKKPFTAVMSFFTSLSNQKSTQGNFEDSSDFKMDGIQYSNQFDQSEPDTLIDQPFDAWFQRTQKSESLQNPHPSGATSTFKSSLLTTNSSSAENFVKDLSSYDGRTRFVLDDDAFN